MHSCTVANFFANPSIDEKAGFGADLSMVDQRLTLRKRTKNLLSNRAREEEKEEEKRVTQRD